MNAKDELKELTETVKELEARRDALARRLKALEGERAALDLATPQGPGRLKTILHDLAEAQAEYEATGLALEAARTRLAQAEAAARQRAQEEAAAKAQAAFVPVARAAAALEQALAEYEGALRAARTTGAPVSAPAGTDRLQKTLQGCLGTWRARWPEAFGLPRPPELSPKERYIRELQTKIECYERSIREMERSRHEGDELWGLNIRRAKEELERLRKELREATA